MAFGSIVAHNPAKTKILIVGGGPSGLVALKELREVGFDCVCYEAQDGVGGAFRIAYENMFLTISNRLMGFSDFADPAPLEYSTRERYVEYLECYATLFGLNPYLHFNTTITSAKIVGGKWEVMATQEGKEMKLECDRLFIATGSNHTPKYAPVPGYTGQILHSSDWKGATGNDQVAGKNVLVIGASESAADISADSAQISRSTTLWTRRPVPIGPRFLNDKSNDELTSMKNQPNDPPKIHEMLESITVSQVSQLESTADYCKERFALFKALAGTGNKTTLNLLGIYNLNACLSVKDGDKRTDQVFAVPKTTRLLTAVSRGQVDLFVAKNAKFEGTKIKFSQFHQRNFECPMKDPNHKEELDIDVIIMCTGFKTDFAWLDVDIDWNARTWFKNCIPPGYEDKLAFLGWTRPHQGAIPACSEMLARYLALLYTGQKSLPADWKMQIQKEKHVAENWYTEAPGYATVVDYPSFMTSMAKLIGCEPVRPSIFNLKRWIQFYTFPVWPCFYRTQGPGARPEVLDFCLNQHSTFESLPPGGTIIGGLTAWRRALFQVMFVNPLFYAITMILGGREDLGTGWYRMKSKRYIGMHGVNMGLKDVFAPNA